MKKVTVKNLCSLYQSEKNNALDVDLLLDVASRFNEIAQNIPGFDDEADTDMGKDAYNFHCGYKIAVGRNDMSLLMREVDFLIHGIHTLDADIVSEYVSGANKELLDFIYHWDGSGNLYFSWQQAA